MSTEIISPAGGVVFSLERASQPLEASSRVYTFSIPYIFIYIYTYVSWRIFVDSISAHRNVWCQRQKIKLKIVKKQCVFSDLTRIKKIYSERYIFFRVGGTRTVMFLQNKLLNSICEHSKFSVCGHFFLFRKATLKIYTLMIAGKMLVSIFRKSYNKKT